MANCGIGHDVAVPIRDDATVNLGLNCRVADPKPYVQQRRHALLNLLPIQCALLGDQNLLVGVRVMDFEDFRLTR